MQDIKEKIEKGNREALRRMIDSQPVWVDVRKAMEVCPGLKSNMIMHAGPPIEWERRGFPGRCPIGSA